MISPGVEFEEIWGYVSGKRPPWLPSGLDHIFTIPMTQSCVFYPYGFSSDDEDELSRLCSDHGYALVRKPKEESEYHPNSYKILILEPGYDDEKIECGCGLVAKFLRIHKARMKAGTLDLCHVGEALEAVDDVLRTSNRCITNSNIRTMPWRMGGRRQLWGQ